MCRIASHMCKFCIGCLLVKFVRLVCVAYVAHDNDFGAELGVVLGDGVEAGGQLDGCEGGVGSRLDVLGAEYYLSA